MHRFHAARVRSGVLTPNRIFVVFGVLMGGMFVARIPKEERKRIDKFGEEYREDLARTGRVFPKILQSALRRL